MDRQDVKPPFAYYGGKTTLGPKIAALLPAHDHYIEPFAGSLAVLLAKAPTTWEPIAWRCAGGCPDEWEDDE